MSVVVNEFEVVTTPTETPSSAGSTSGGSGEAAQQPSPWAALEVAEGQARLAERAARLEAC